MKTHIMITSITAFILIIMACTSEEKVIEPPIIVPSEYASCCGIEDSTVYAIGDAWLTVPNVFTPNADGVNDLFYPKRSSDSIKISVFSVYDTTFNAPNSPTLIHSTQGFSYSNINNYAWKGRKRLATGESVYHKGRFKYRILFYYKNIGRSIEGEACLVACGEDAKVFRNNAGCIFESQIDDATLPDASLSSGEADCF